ncbi:MAG TPA: hypothetical protein VHF47_09825, partial [Acidimicrobiales bacterium]|nr:hypothetical protein [Acidimicrobiales bacterium]
EQDAETAETETDDGGRKPAGTGRPEAPGKSTEHRPDDPGKPDADDTEDVDTDDVDTDNTDSSGKGSSSSSKGRSGTGKAPDDGTQD